MHIALISDIHANLHALNAVIEHAQAQKIRHFWNMGDFLGYFAFPEEVIDRVRALKAVSILGNYDHKVLKFHKKKHKWKKNKAPLKYLAFKWAYEALSKENEVYLKSLPDEHRLRVEGRAVLLTHGSPVSNREPLQPDTPVQRLRNLAGISRADVVICGHSHTPFSQEVDGVWFINPGSVGRPDDGDPRASYAILHMTQGRLRVTPYRVTYDVEGAVRAIRKNELPEAFAQMLVRGLPLDEAIAQMAE